jgi:uncharacterized sulfatase
VGQLRALRDGRFKYHDRHSVPFGNPPDLPVAFHVPRGPWLFDLQSDPDESYDVSERYPELAQRMRQLLEARRRELEENPRGWR